MHWAVLRVSIMFRNSIPVFVQYHLLISLDSVQVRFLAHPKTTSLALAHVHNMATLALKLSGRSLLYSKSASLLFKNVSGRSPLWTAATLLDFAQKLNTFSANSSKISSKLSKASATFSNISIRFGKLQANFGSFSAKTKI